MQLIKNECMFYYLLSRMRNRTLCCIGNNSLNLHEKKLVCKLNILSYGKHLHLLILHSFNIFEKNLLFV